MFIELPLFEQGAGRRHLYGDTQNVVPSDPGGGTGGLPPDFGRYINPISIRAGGGDIMPTISLIPPSGFSDLPTVLGCMHLAKAAHS